MNNTLHSCNGDSSSYRVGDNTWNTTYISNDGDELEIDVFYATFQNQLWVRHLQVCPPPYSRRSETLFTFRLVVPILRIHLVYAYPVAQVSERSYDLKPTSNHRYPPLNLYYSDAQCLLLSPRPPPPLSPSNLCQPHMDPSLYSALNETVIRLNITCGKSENTSCVEFTANFTEATPYNSTNLYDFEDECSHGFSSGEQVPTFKVHAASPVGPTAPASLNPGSTLILAGKADQGLPWSEGFYSNGSQKNDEFWGGWWASVYSQYNASQESSGSGSSSGGCPG